MSEKRKSWTPYEENRILCVWRSNLEALHRGKKRVELCRDLEAEFRNEGLDTSAVFIERKMDSFKRKYLSLKNNKLKQHTWKDFNKFVEIMNYEPETADTQHESLTEDSSNGISSSVHAEEVTARHSNEEDGSQNEDENIRPSSRSACSSKKSLPRKAKQAQTKEVNTNPLQKPKRRVWALQEEEIFLEVWQKHVRALRTETDKSQVYKDMESDLHNQGIEIDINVIKSKIRSLTRRFRNHQIDEDPKKEWIHYSTVAELLGNLDQFPENSESLIYIDESDDDMQIYPKICIETEDNPPVINSAIDNNVNESNPKVLSEPLDDTLPNDLHSTADNESMVPERCDFELNMMKDISIEETCIAQSAPQISPKTQLTKEFGQFVTKELNMLSDDLLIEAKRQIYNIICVMQIKQLQANKTTHNT